MEGRILDGRVAFLLSSASGCPDDNDFRYENHLWLQVHFVLLTVDYRMCGLLCGVLIEPQIAHLNNKSAVDYQVAIRLGFW